MGKRQARGRAAEVSVRCLVDAVVTAAKVDGVKVYFEDLRLFVAGFHIEGKEEFFCLAHHGAVGVQKEVFDRLLGDGAGTFLYFAVLDVDEGGTHHAFDVESCVVIEAFVFRSDDGVLHMVGDVVDLRIAELWCTAVDGIFERDETIDACPSVGVKLGQVIGRKRQCAYFCRGAV